jgi:hypothetical protein
MKYVVAGFCTAAILMAARFISADETKRVHVGQLGTGYQLVGKLETPFGESVTVVGIVETQKSKEWGDPDLRVQRIAGRVADKDVVILVRPYFSTWGEPPSVVGGFALPKLDAGKTYEMEGYETGGYVGIPADVHKKVGIAMQTSDYHFHEEFVVYKAKQVKALTSLP